jgi:hypothetical protein
VQLARRYEDDVTFLGIAGRDGEPAMREFVERYDLPFPSVADVDLEVWKRGRVRGQPVWIFVEPDGSGRLHYRPSGRTVRSELRRLAGD